MSMVRFDESLMDHSCSPWAPDPFESENRLGLSPFWEYEEDISDWYDCDDLGPAPEPEPDDMPNFRLRHLNRNRVLASRRVKTWCGCDRNLVPIWTRCSVCGRRNGRYRFKKGGEFQLSE